MPPCTTLKQCADVPEPKSVALDQRGLQAAQRGFTGRGCAGCSPADDEHVVFGPGQFGKMSCIGPEAEQAAFPCFRTSKKRRSL